MLMLISLAVRAEVDHMAKQSLRLVGPPWEPFLFEDRPQKGLATEVVVEALTRANYQTDVAIRPWRRVLIEAENGVADVLIGLWFNPERAKHYLYSEPYYTNKIGFVSNQKSTFVYKNLEDLKGLRIGVRKGASFGAEFDHAGFLNKSPTLDSASMLKMLALGRLDLGIGDRLILAHILQKEPELSKQIKFVEPLYTERPLHMAVMRSLPNHQKIINDFNRELVKMKREGRLQQIIDLYN
jgi:polar amino acid transport system substrate-binding protein